MNLDLSQYGYHTRCPEQLAISALLSRPRNGVRALLLEGAHGTELLSARLWNGFDAHIVDFAQGLVVGVTGKRLSTVMVAEAVPVVQAFLSDLEQEMNEEAL